MNFRPMRALVVIGTRPEAIKLAPVVRALRGAAAEAIVCTTGQHTDLLSAALRALDLAADCAIALSRDSSRPDATLAALLGKLPDVIAETAPDWVIVQGDTASAFAGALAGFHARIPVAHVEAGLRSGDLARPWPEEAYRGMIARIARLHFAPTEAARRNLLAEGIADRSILLTGNTVVDALHHALPAARQPAVAAHLAALLGPLPADRPLVLATAHRRESIGAGLRNIAEALRAVAADGAATIVFSSHPNPEVAEAFRGLAGTDAALRAIPPQDYLAFLHLLDRADIVATDSGGIQEEASCLGKPVLVLRDKTERPELIEAGNGVLVGTDRERIAAALRGLIAQPERRLEMARAHDSFGDGRAGARIAARLSEEWGIDRAAAGRMAAPVQP